MAEVKLIGAATSPYFTRVEWALKLKGVAYECIQEDVRNKSPSLLKLNPANKKIPVLVHGDKAISESLLILEYIDETWKHNPLLPQDPYDKAKARFWAKFCDKCLSGALNAFKLEGQDKEKAVNSVKRSLTFLEKQIKGKSFFGGEKMGFLDLVVGWIPHCLSTMEELGSMALADEDSFPNLHKWSQNFTKVSTIKECLPPRDQQLNYFQAILNHTRRCSVSKL